LGRPSQRTLAAAITFTLACVLLIPAGGFIVG
jgi:hypothetical protein